MRSQQFTSDSPSSFAAVTRAYVMPVLGTFFIGPEGISVRRGAPIRAISSRLLLPHPLKPDPVSLALNRRRKSSDTGFPSRSHTLVEA
jgi:hypothetical protein